MTSANITSRISVPRCILFRMRIFHDPCDIIDDIRATNFSSKLLQCIPKLCVPNQKVEPLVVVMMLLNREDRPLIF